MSELLVLRIYPKSRLKSYRKLNFQNLIVTDFEFFAFEKFAGLGTRPVFELLNLQMLGFPVFSSTYVSWYLSAFMFASFLIYPLMCKNRELCNKYLAPLCALFLYGLIMKEQSTVGNVLGWHGFIFSGMLRGVAGIFWGGGVGWLTNLAAISTL